MDGADLQAAERVLAGLSEAGRGQAKDIASRMRLTGMVATLQWLSVGGGRAGRGELLRRLEDELEVSVRDLDQLDTPSRVRLYERANRLGDALHMLARATGGR
jgi:hypothetical protein